MQPFFMTAPRFYPENTNKIAPVQLEDISGKGSPLFRAKWVVQNAKGEQILDKTFDSRYDAQRAANWEARTVIGKNANNCAATRDKLMAFAQKDIPITIRVENSHSTTDSPDFNLKADHQLWISVHENPRDGHYGRELARFHGIYPHVLDDALKMLGSGYRGQPAIVEFVCHAEKQTADYGEGVGSERTYFETRITELNVWDGFAYTLDSRMRQIQAEYAPRQMYWYRGGKN